MSIRRRGSFILPLLVAWCLLGAGAAPAQEKKGFDPRTLPKVLKDGADSLEKDIAAGKTEIEAVQQQMKQAEADLQTLGNQIATLKASQAAGELQLKAAQEALDGFSQRQGQVAAQSKDFQDKRDQLAKQVGARTSAFDGLRQEVERLKAAKNPLWKSPDMHKAWERYLHLAKQYQAGANQALERYDGVLKVLGEEDQALTGVIGELKTYVEVSRKEELLKRQSAGSFFQTVKLTWKSLLGMPARLAEILADPLLTQKVAATLRLKWAPLLGLLALFVILVWTVLQVRRHTLPKLGLWQAEVAELGTRVILKAAEIVVTHLFVLSCAAWLALTEWVLGVWQSQLARIFLLGLLVWVGLRLGLQLIQAVFAGKEHGGILPLDDGTARFYRRHLKLLLIYLLIFGWFGLDLLQRLGLEADSYQILEQAFEVGLLVWVLGLLRSRHFDLLRAELPGPAWLRTRGLFLTVRLLLLAILTTIILTSLLGFVNLSAYIAQAAFLLGLLLVVFWVIWQVAKTLLEHTISGRRRRDLAPKRLRRQEELLRKNYLAIMKVVVFFLVVTVFLAMLNVWGIDQTFLVWLSQGLTWGTRLGPLRLSLLNLGLAALALYLGRWFSRFLQVFLEVRFSQREDWDSSLHYTIANTLHYVILAIALLMALSFLGISFGDLAIVAGGLGVGIGFGLQNIVNNFFSGLILLFERPIKVGDLLVIDGQWGRVREIRVRSTIFENNDRSVLIIPNSDLIANKILNWTHYGPGISRLTLKVGVSYDSDVHQVTRVLDKVCRANPRVVAEPPPQIFFEAYGDSSLNFTIWVHLKTPMDRIPATHELNTAIFEAFQERGIQIPFPQQELIVRNWPGPGGPLSPPPPEDES
jgi:potassium-dependent mechanosensitive channel